MQRVTAIKARAAIEHRKLVPAFRFVAEFVAEGAQRLQAAMVALSRTTAALVVAPPWDSHRWRFVAQDSSGEWWGYNTAPKQIAWGWGKHWDSCRISKGIPSTNWRESLMERPDAD